MQTGCMETGSKKNNVSTSSAIVIAGALIAGAIFFHGSFPAVQAPQLPAVAQQASDLDKMRPISAADHIRGNSNAPVTIVEYSDTECPFCKRFHETVKQVMDEYGKDGRVAWVYRNFPLDQLHPKAQSEAVALECAGDQGGNDTFWAYTDRLYEVTPSNNGLDPVELQNIAKYVGLDVAQFNTCLTSGTFTKRVQDDVQNAAATGGNGTPWSIVVSKSGKKYPLSGAQPYEAVKKLIELALQEK